MCGRFRAAQQESPLESETDRESGTVLEPRERTSSTWTARKRLKEAFEKLTPNQRTVIELAYYEGMSQTGNVRAPEAAARAR